MLQEATDLIYYNDSTYVLHMIITDSESRKIQKSEFYCLFFLSIKNVFDVTINDAKRTNKLNIKLESNNLYPTTGTKF